MLPCSEVCPPPPSPCRSPSPQEVTEGTLGADMWIPRQGFLTPRTWDGRALRGSQRLEGRQVPQRTPPGSIHVQLILGVGRPCSPAAKHIMTSPEVWGWGLIYKLLNLNTSEVTPISPWCCYGNEDTGLPTTPGSSRKSTATPASPPSPVGSKAVPSGTRHGVPHLGECRRPLTLPPRAGVPSTEPGAGGSFPMSGREPLQLDLPVRIQVHLPSSLL